MTDEIENKIKEYTELIDWLFLEDYIKDINEIDLPIAIQHYVKERF